MTDLMSLYGTDQPPRAPVRAGRVEFALRGGALLHLRADGREVIRQVAFLARDRDWSTLVPEVGPVAEDRDGEARRFRYRLSFANGGGRLPVHVTLRARGDLEAAGRADGVFETNRTGFTVPHRSEEARFPDLITPGSRSRKSRGCVPGKSRGGPARRAAALWLVRGLAKTVGGASEWGC